MISIVANFSEKLPVLFIFLLLSVSTANLSCLLAITFSSLRFLFNFTSLQSFESGQRGFLFSHFPVLSSILSLSFLCSSVSEALFTLSFSFLSELFVFFHVQGARGGHSNNRLDKHPRPGSRTGSSSQSRNFGRSSDIKSQGSSTV